MRRVRGMAQRPSNVSALRSTLGEPSKCGLGWTTTTRSNVGLIILLPYDYVSIRLEFESNFPFHHLTISAMRKTMPPAPAAMAPNDA